MSDIFKDNPELFTTGSFQDIAQRMEMEWWEESRKKIDKLSKEIGFDIIEVLPEEYKQNYIKSREELDQENPDDRFYLKTFPPSKSGNDYEIVCSNDVFKATKKITKKEKSEVMDILYGLSQEPTGSLLPVPHKVKPLIKKEVSINLHKKLRVPTEATLYQYKCGRSKRKRCIWYGNEEEKQITIVYYGSRNNFDKQYN